MNLHSLHPHDPHTHNPTARLPSRKRGEQPSQAMITQKSGEAFEDADDDASQAGRSQPARLQARTRRGRNRTQESGDALGEDTAVPNAGRTQPTRLQSRLQSRKQRGDGGAQASLSEEQHSGQESNHLQPSRPTRLPTRNKGKKAQAARAPDSAAENAPSGARLLSDATQDGLTPRVRI